MSNLINVTIIHDDGSPTSFQAWKGFSEFLRRAEEAVVKGAEPSESACRWNRPVHRVYAFEPGSEPQTGTLREYSPKEILEMARIALVLKADFEEGLFGK